MSETTSRGSRRLRLLFATLLILATAAGGFAMRGAAKGGNAPLISAAPPAASTGSGGPVRLDVHLDRSSVLAGGDGTVRMELVLSGEPRERGAAMPTDLIVVLDRSGSMKGEPLRFAKAAIRELIGQLQEGDRFALVSYAFDARTDVPLAAADATARGHWHRTLDRIPAQGGTHMAAGLDLAHALLTRADANGRVPRVILLSDGHANQGDHSFGGLTRRAGRAVSAEYVLSTVGIGQGFDEHLMSALADSGTGDFYYLPHLEALAGVFADEFASARETVAKALSVAITPADGVQVVSAAGYPLEYSTRSAHFRPGDLFASQERRIWVTLRAPTDLVTDVALGQVDVTWADGSGKRRVLTLDPLPKVTCVAGERDYYASFDESVYKRGDRFEAIGHLKQEVARKLDAGERKAAEADVSSFLTRFRTEQSRAFGDASPEDAAEVEALLDTVSAPAAATPEVQNELSKKLLEEGRDSRRQGSKRR